MNFPPPLSEPLLKLVAFFRNGIKAKRPEFAVARRQQWHKLVPIIDDLTGKLLLAQRDAAAYQYLATALHLSATGQLTEEQLATSPLSKAECADCLNLLRIYQRSLISPQPQGVASRADMENMLRGVSPGYALMDELEALGLGYYTGGFHDKWDWAGSSDAWGRLTDAQVQDLYARCSK